MVVQLGGLLGRPADQPDVDERVGVEAPVPAAVRVEDDVVGAGAHLRGDAAGQRREVGRSSGVGAERSGSDGQDEGRAAAREDSEGVSGPSGRERSARATALVEVVGTPGSPDLPEDRGQHGHMGPQHGRACPIPPRDRHCPRCPDIASVSARVEPLPQVRERPRALRLVVDLVPEPVVPAHGEIVRARPTASSARLPAGSQIRSAVPCCTQQRQPQLAGARPASSVIWSSSARERRDRGMSLVVDQRGPPR